MTSPELGALGALAAWRARVKRDPRSRLTFDTLHSAACLEANAFDAARDGLPAIAEAWNRAAAERLISGARSAA